ncbi:MAG: DUF4838 domain-containing protein [Ruminococcaceae bacterium]|nr:DUF4838 domain-containing protein [Oscillospiraceae bacterium]MBR3597934.1 DUF4838 domain-containing protein [Clostridia bacterium]
MEIFRAMIAFIEVFMFSLGIIPVDTNINYGGDEYVAPVIETPLYIAEDGVSDYFIVADTENDECIATAADELQTYLEKICGVSLPVVSESSLPEGGKAIALGETAISDSVQFDYSVIKEDGFLLHSDGENFIIRGEDSRGTLFGVYTFLEEYLGVRWFTPTLEVVPENDDVIIDKNLHRVVEPSFSVRRNDAMGTNEAYRARTKMNVSFHKNAEKYGGTLTYSLWDASLLTLVPKSLFSEHPEYFAVGEDGNRTTDHVCLTNPDVLDLVVENAREIMTNATNGAKFIHIGQDDNINYCRCENCEALYEKYGAVCAPTIIFTNNLADILGPEFPDYTFTFYAYNETDRPPTDTSLKCRPNVAPVLCGLHKACRSHSLLQCGAQDGDDSFINLYGDPEPTIAEDFRVWTEIAEKTYIYDYTINFLLSAQFFSNFEYMQETMAYMHDIGITGYIYNCGDGHPAAFNELRNYLLCKLQWDVNADVEYHMNDFLKAYYGEEAAGYIKEIIDIQTAQIKATAHAFDFDWHYQSGYYPIHTMIKLDLLWEKALNSDITEVQLNNVEIANLSWEFFKANQMQLEYFFLNPFRMLEQEWLYDELDAHGMDRVSSFSIIPEKDDINFIQRPIMWE